MPVCAQQTPTFALNLVMINLQSSNMLSMYSVFYSCDAHGMQLSCSCNFKGRERPIHRASAMLSAVAGR